MPPSSVFRRAALTEIAPNIFLIPVPLPRNPLKAVNCYLIRGGERDLLVDTGMNRPECREALYAGLADLSVELPRTDLFVTHLHADHSGLAAELAGRGATPYASAEDARIINSEGALAGDAGVRGPQRLPARRAAGTPRGSTRATDTGPWARWTSASSPRGMW